MSNIVADEAMSHRIVNPPELGEPRGFSHAVVAGEEGEGDGAVLDHLEQAAEVFIPAVALGELFFGAAKSSRASENTVNGVTGLPILVTELLPITISLLSVATAPLRSMSRPGKNPGGPGQGQN